ncbi:hypothetical protein KGQ19_12950 [Catenulispora sp. NL8]|uniref:Condensation domain-containing protein n=1 Tax=Catenulispora pinistramenti TaxID=2705254 RepID=A0ABS5KP08_9ACTN|nr:condensation domain-containing protein [Catenulispora pinistramenti]MBS2547775.1 hypothetical protein [Catenulispora pinistramenti]
METTAEEFLDRLRALDVRLEPSGDGGLRYDAPAGALTGELLTQLRRRRGGLLACLGGPPDRLPEVVASEAATVQQAGLAAYSRDAPLPHVLNVGTKMTITGHLDPVALETALAALVARHEGMRTRIVSDGSDGAGWRQDVLAPVARTLPVEDLSDLNEAACAARVAEICREEVNKPFDIGVSTEPRFRLLRLASECWVLLNTVHHVATDGWSFTVQQRDLAELYRAALTGTPSGLAEVWAQPRDYARRQLEWPLDPATVEHRLDYWRGVLDGSPLRIDLPTDRPRGDGSVPMTGRGRTSASAMPGATRAAVEALARARRTTPFGVTAAAGAVLLAGLTGQRDLVMQFPYANRDDEIFADTVMFSATSLALRLRLDRAPAFADLVDQASRAVWGAIDNLLPLGRILADLKEHGVPDVPERFRVIAVHQNSIELGIDLPGLTVVTEDLPTDTARADLTFGVAPYPDPADGYRVFAEHPLDLWDAETVDEWMRTYAAIVAKACRAPDTPLEHLVLEACPTPKPCYWV